MNATIIMLKRWLDERPPNMNYILRRAEVEEIVEAFCQKEKVGPPKDWTPDRSWQGGQGDKE